MPIGASAFVDCVPALDALNAVIESLRSTGKRRLIIILDVEAIAMRQNCPHDKNSSRERQFCSCDIR
jgi:hypothetical protein